MCPGTLCFVPFREGSLLTLVLPTRVLAPVLSVHLKVFNGKSVKSTVDELSVRTKDL